MNTCPDCKNQFFQPFVCTTCGAQKLYDATVTSLHERNDSLADEVESLRKDAERLQWLADNPRGAQIVVDGRTQDCVLWGISGHPRATLREAIDTAVTAAGAPLQESP